MMKFRPSEPTDPERLVASNHPILVLGGVEFHFSDQEEMKRLVCVSKRSNGEVEVSVREP